VIAKHIISISRITTTGKPHWSHTKTLLSNSCLSYS